MSVRVIGLGNVLMGDDGFGPHVIAALQACCDFSEDVAVLDLGTPGLDLTPFVTDADALIVVDTVNSHGAPGELRLYHRDQILRYAPQARLGPHDPSLKEALLLAEMTGCAPRHVLLVGAIPEKTETGHGPRHALPAARLVGAETRDGSCRVHAPREHHRRGGSRRGSLAVPHARA